MTSNGEFRARQRLGNFEKALSQLEGACQRHSYSDLERAGLVQMFGFTFELLWKTLKDILLLDGVVANTPREAFRKAFAATYLDGQETETLLDALEKRNLLYHTYEEETAKEAEALIKGRYAPVLLNVCGRLRERFTA